VTDVKQWETIKVEQDEPGIAWVYMNRPEKRNAMNPRMHFEMVEVLDELAMDDDVALVVLTGAGRAFSAGQDIREMFQDQEGQPEAMQRVARVAHRWRYEMLGNFPKVTVAAVNGWCCGGALTPVAMCDFAIAAEEATFSVSEVNWGIIPGGLVAKVLSDILRPRDALYYCLLAEPFDGSKAAEIGLVNYAVPLERLSAEIHLLAEKVMSKNLAAVRATKEALRAVRRMDAAQAEDYLLAKSAQLAMLDTERGQQQGMDLFLDGKQYRPGMASYKTANASA
jgi:feruloyl-CoA hydratase/lyase